MKKTPVADQATEILAEIYPSPQAQIVKPPKVSWFVDGAEQTAIEMEPTTGRFYRASLPAQPSSTKIDFFITATDSAGRMKTAPIRAPGMKINLEVK